MSQLHVRSDGVRYSAQVHDQVATGLSQLMGAAAPTAAGVQTSHGPIAAAVSTALSNVLDTRQDTVQSTATSGATISELLQKAARMYERGDTQGAERLRAAAEVLQRQQGDAAPAGGAVAPADGTATASPSTAAGPAAGAAGAGMVGQMLGQVGQLAGMLVQPLAGIAQGLSQVPQHVMQGVQGAAGSDTTSSAKGAVDRTRERADDDAREPSEPGGRSADRATEQRPTADGAAAGGPAPGPPAAAERPRPAQTRPQAH